MLKSSSSSWTIFKRKSPNATNNASVNLLAANGGNHEASGGGGGKSSTTAGKSNNNNNNNNNEDDFNQPSCAQCLAEEGSSSHMSLTREQLFNRQALPLFKFYILMCSFIFVSIMTVLLISDLEKFVLFFLPMTIIILLLNFTLFQGQNIFFGSFFPVYFRFSFSFYYQLLNFQRFVFNFKIYFYLIIMPKISI